MAETNHRNHPYVLKAGEGWTYDYGVNFTVKSSVLQKGCGTAFLEYRTKQSEEPAQPHA